MRSQLSPALARVVPSSRVVARAPSSSLTSLTTQTAMYVEASTNLKQQVARVAALEGERAELSRRLGVVETRLRQSADLHDLQVGVCGGRACPSPSRVPPLSLTLFSVMSTRRH